MENDERVFDIILKRLDSIEKKVDEHQKSVILLEERAKNRATLISTLISLAGLVIAAIISSFKGHQ